MPELKVLEDGWDRPLKGYHLQILGRSDLKNGLLAYFLEHNGGALCSMKVLNGAAQGFREAASPGCDLVLWDVAGLMDAEVRRWLELLMPMSSPLAMFDMEREAGFEKYALRTGAKGFFYLGDPLFVLIRGVSKILAGELWVPRSVMEKCVLGVDTSTPGPKTPSGKPRLTKREVEILGLLAQGFSNAQIADSLFLSVHTVKTHIYNIYQKIQVVNRTQAARWFEENLLRRT